MGEIIIRSGTIVGKQHIKKNTNNQDSYFLKRINIRQKEYIYGAVFDGCTNRRIKISNNEVGSILLSQFIESEVKYILQSGVNLLEIPNILYPRCIGYLNNILRLTILGGISENCQFIQRNLMSTILGFIFDTKEEYLIIYSSGDGLIIKDKMYQNLGEKLYENTPQYIGYHLLDKELVPDNFNIDSEFSINFGTTKYLNRFALSTDGLNEIGKDWNLLNNIWTYESKCKSGLQWWLNKNKSLFSDDCTIVSFSKNVGE